MRAVMMRMLNPNRLICALTLVGMSLSPLAQAQTVTSVFLGESDSYEDGVFLETFFVAGVEGVGISSAGIITPGGFAVPLFEDDPGIFVTEVPFFSIQDREAVFPDGTYQLFVNNVFQGSAFFTATTPDGLVNITAPGHLSAVQPLSPLFQFANSCTNCTEPLGLFVVEVDDELVEQSVELPLTDTSFTFPAPLIDQKLHLFEAGASRVTTQMVNNVPVDSVSERMNGIRFAPGATGKWTGICGDPSGNLILESGDIQSVRAALADPVGSPLSPFELSRCPVVGDAQCDIRQLAVMLRTFDDVSSAPGFDPICGAAPPSALGAYSGTLTETRSGCLDAASNGTTVVPISIDITSQDNFGVLEGTATVSVSGIVSDIFIRARIDGSGGLIGATLSEITASGSFDGIALTELTGTLVGDVLTVAASGADLVGDTCSLSENISASR